MVLEQWGPDRLHELAELVSAAMPDEALSSEELEGVVFDGGGVVLGADDGLAAVAVVLREPGGAPVASVALAVVHPSARRAGRGRELLEAAEAWAGEQGAAAVTLGAGAPFYLWPGVEERHTGMLRLAERCGYEESPRWQIDMALPVGFRSAAPEGVVTRRVRSETDVAGVLGLAEAEWPAWRAEVERAIGHGTCHAAFVAASEDPQGAATEAVGFACHSVSRAGRVGPMAVRPDHEGRGIGRALLGQVCRDLELAEFDVAHVSWVGPYEFYAALGAEVCATYRNLTKIL